MSKPTEKKEPKPIEPDDRQPNPVEPEEPVTVVSAAPEAEYLEDDAQFEDAVRTEIEERGCSYITAVARVRARQGQEST